MKKFIVFLVSAMLTTGLFTACGQRPTQETEPAPNSDTTQDAGNNSKKPSVVFVVTGQLGDKSFNDSGAAGIKTISDTLGCETKIIEIGRDQTKWEPTFMDLSESGQYDIIITNGSSSRETIETVAAEFPEQKFIIFDSEIEKGVHPNIYAISYKQNEGSYMAGVLAALVTSSDMPNANPDKKIGFIGGMEHPVISDFLVGYIEGAVSVDPDIKVYVSYIGSWDDTARGKENAIAQYNQGVDIIFPAAEQAGLGCIEAAVDMDKYIIGVDSDQAMLFKGVDEAKANVILSSMLKEVGNSLVRAVEKHMDGSLAYGDFESLGVKDNSTGLAVNEYYDKNISDEIKQKIEESRTQVIEGKVKITSALGLGNEAINEIINSVKP